MRRGLIREAQRTAALKRVTRVTVRGGRRDLLTKPPVTVKILAPEA